MTNKNIKSYYHINKQVYEYLLIAIPICTSKSEHTPTKKNCTGKTLRSSPFTEEQNNVLESEDM